MSSASLTLIATSLSNDAPSFADCGITFSVTAVKAAVFSFLRDSVEHLVAQRGQRGQVGHDLRYAALPSAVTQRGADGGQAGLVSFSFAAILLLELGQGGRVGLEDVQVCEGTVLVDRGLGCTERGDRLGGVGEAGLGGRRDAGEAVDAHQTDDDQQRDEQSDGREQFGQDGKFHALGDRPGRRLGASADRRILPMRGQSSQFPRNPQIACDPRGVPVTRAGGSAGVTARDGGGARADRRLGAGLCRPWRVALDGRDVPHPRAGAASVEPSLEMLLELRPPRRSRPHPGAVESSRERPELVAAGGHRRRVPRLSADGSVHHVRFLGRSRRRDRPAGRHRPGRHRRAADRARAAAPTTPSARRCASGSPSTRASSTCCGGWRPRWSTRWRRCGCGTSRSRRCAAARSGTPRTSTRASSSRACAPRRSAPGEGKPGTRLAAPASR